jgi:Cu(I)/Ag(I) efflux system membrane fusion protein
MHPQIVRSEPGQCPICGMDLVPTADYGFAGEPVPHPQSLYVPRAAVLLAGGNSVVYVETEPGRFEIRPVTVGPVLRDKIVTLDGLEAGEQVATAGNFLIDSQMQLAGKPSLIDPTRAVAKARQPKGPLQFDKVAIATISGAAGELLESLFAAYFAVHEALAADASPPAEASQSLHQLATTLTEADAVPSATGTLLQEVAAHSEHLHHMDLAAARKAFKPSSHAVVTLASQVRGESAPQPFTHFFCPMVPEGGGDWLQPGGAPLNPYFGSQMLRCGEKVNVFPTATRPGAPADEHQHDEGASSEKAGA